MKIIVLSGSPREQSVSRRIARHLVGALQAREIDRVDFVDIRDEGLAPIQIVWNREDLIPESHRENYQKMDEADGFILVSPEYNGGYSSAMKNFLDHFPKRVFQRKSWGIATGSTGAMGGMRASQQLILLGAGFSAVVCPRMLITPQMDRKFDVEGNLTDDGFQQQIDGFIDEFLWLTSALSTPV